ncbi:MAG: nicotinate-nicotinamide nucleotide adenylyltransferase [Nitrospinae bacterium]|nr:nicotinate-nicotinamide nucleotide adenylyltransferase [Nitrospinota bacterium]
MDSRKPIVCEEMSPQLTIVRGAPAGVSHAQGAGQLGIFSGAFNPITVAHVALARSAYQHYRLHEVLFLLPTTQPHKDIVGAPIEARLQMMALAVQDEPAFAVAACTHGLFIDICHAVQRVYPPHTHLWFLTGRDAAERVLTWPYGDPVEALDALFACASLLVADREGRFVLPAIPPVQAHADRIHPLPLPHVYSHVSATEIRARLAEGRAVTDLVPPAVLAYIQAHGLYRERVD